MRLLPALTAAALALVPMAALAQGALPAHLILAIKANPEAYLQDVAALIASAGQGDAITADQVAVSVAVTRARARVAAMAPLMAADLDGDGRVTGAELAAASGALTEEGRGALDLGFAKADQDGDGLLSGAELAAAGEAAALSALAPARLAQVKVLMGFDADADGRVTLAEVRSGLAALVS